MPTYTNLSILQGWLEIESVQAIPMDHTPVAVVNGWVYTTDHDGLENFFGERHPVVISGRPAETILDITRKLNEKYPHLSGISLVHLPGTPANQPQILVSQGRPYVIAQGKLLSRDGRSCVDLKHISFLGLPWGALDALAEMEPALNQETQALVATLSPQEKAQISQMVDTALRTLIEMRPSCQKTGRGQA